MIFYHLSYLLLVWRLFTWSLNKHVECILNGIKTPNDGPLISHLFNADDSIFMGKWSYRHTPFLQILLDSYNASIWLCDKKQTHTSKLFSDGTDLSRISSMTRLLHHQAGSFPFIYLGIPVRMNMNLEINWKPVIEKFEAKFINMEIKLSLLWWKNKSLNFGQFTKLFPFTF